jgi:hypothetical protein
MKKTLLYSFVAGVVITTLFFLFVFQKGCRTYSVIGSDTTYVPVRVEVPVPAASAQIIQGKTLTKYQRDTLWATRIIRDTNSYDPSYYINDSIKWYQNYSVPLAEGGIQLIRDSGWYYFSHYADCIDRADKNIKISSTPLRPVIFEKTITNTIERRYWLEFKAFGQADLVRGGQWSAGVKGQLNIGALSAFLVPCIDDGRFKMCAGGEVTVFKF